jgi:hypothetical protein
MGYEVENLLKIEAISMGMSLMSLARRDRGKKDPLIKIGTAIIYLEEAVCEKESIIREQSIISIEGGVPKIEGFHDEALIETIQSEIAVIRNNMGVLQGIIDEIEAVFVSFNLESTSMELLEARLNAVQAVPETIARRINRLVISLIQKNPGMTLPMLFANEELLVLETQRGAAVTEGLLEAQKLIKLKDSLIPLCRDGGEIAEDVFHPLRALVKDPASVSEMLSA